MNRLIWLLVLFSLGANGLQSPAQPAEADRKLFEDVETKAQNGDAIAQYTFGKLFSIGFGGPQKLVEAAKWYRKAADQGYAPAQYDIGVCYITGDGLNKDAEEAVKWFRKAADQGYAAAQYNLGLSYSKGVGQDKDILKALKWYHKAAEQGLVAAQFNLGNQYLKGDGVAKDTETAAKWFRKAADQEFADAQNNLAFCYMNGVGVVKDSVEGAKWFRKAAEQGFPLAQKNIGICYQEGNGVTTDYVEAYKWYNLAAVWGIGEAKQRLYNIEARMTTEQIAEAQRLARLFKPRKSPMSLAPTSPEGTVGPRPATSGTGFIITDDGFLVTNEHVVKNSNQVRLVTSAGFIAAKVVKVDTTNDLALLKAVGNFKALPIAASRTVQLGNTVATVGFPNIGLQGFAPKLAKGEIASLSGASDDPRYFQISVPVQPGNSGGALVDERGNVVGVVSAKLNAAAAFAASGELPENVNYAVKSSFLLSFLESVPEVSSRLKEPKSLQTAIPKFEDAVKAAEQAAVLVLVY